ncbi:hypothetical protein HPB51_004888 [Rhipicephalus microplus]|uniref:Uncharacterized protein n=1 Tax=Rhipicephalus microplus TaxID=6941 RepID=A0A9J6E705_RHIMP|nr:hypothetical protein HPB51_004888 [Rhipicephalus microplus]
MDLLPNLLVAGIRVLVDKSARPPAAWSSVSPPSEDPCSNIPPDRPSSASLPPAAPSPLSPPLSSSPGTTAVVVASSQSMATPSEAVVTPSLTAEAAVVASSTSSCSSSFTLPSSSCSSSTTWDSSRPTTISGMAEVMPRTQPQPTCSLADVPSSTLQVPGGQMISPSMWSTAGSSSSSGGTSNDPQQRLTFIFKGNLTASTTASSSSSTSGHPVLALPASSGSGGPKPVPIKLLALPSGASGLALNSSLAELISSPATQGGSSRLAATRSVSPPIRLVVSKMASTAKGAGNINQGSAFAHWYFVVDLQPIHGKHGHEVGDVHRSNSNDDGGTLACGDNQC